MSGWGDYNMQKEEAVNAEWGDTYCEDDPSYPRTNAPSTLVPMVPVGTPSLPRSHGLSTLAPMDILPSFQWSPLERLHLPLNNKIKSRLNFTRLFRRDLNQ
jgi:hypothetical protein